MPDLGDNKHIEPTVPPGTNAGLVSPAGTAIRAEMGTGRSSGLASDTGVTRLVERGKAGLASSLHDLGDRIEHTGRSLESGNMLARPVGRVLDSAGNSLEGGANYLRTHSIRVIGDDFVDGIRHHPLMSAGVAVGVGWMLGQIMGGGEEETRRASSRQEQQEHHEERPVRPDREHESSLLDRVKSHFTEIVAGGFASLAARKIRDRIAGD